LMKRGVVYRSIDEMFIDFRLNYYFSVSVINIYHFFYGGAPD